MRSNVILVNDALPVSMHPNPTRVYRPEVIDLPHALAKLRMSFRERTVLDFEMLGCDVDPWIEMPNASIGEKMRIVEQEQRRKALGEMKARDCAARADLIYLRR